VVATDVDADALAIAQAAAARWRARLVRPDAAHLGAAGAFDLVYARLLLSHLIDPFAALRAMRAAARPGGGVAVEDLNLGNLRSDPRPRGKPWGARAARRARAGAGPGRRRG